MNRVKKGSGWEHLLEIAKMEGLGRAFTWSCGAGCYGIGCEVRKRGKCWAEMFSRRFHLDFKPHLIRKNIDEPVRSRRGAVITPVPRGDLFGLRSEDVKAVMNVIWISEQVGIPHVFALLTKLPQYALDFNPFPKNVWFGVTVNVQRDVWRLDLLQKIDAPKKYCLFEPLYEPINYDLSWLDLAVIGPQNYPTVQPRREWVQSVLNGKPRHIYFKSKLKFS